MYADDLVILSRSEAGLQNCLNALDTYCKKWNLTVNCTKTEVMIFNKTGHLFKNLRFHLGDQQLKVVRNYTYLGITFSISGSFQKAILDLRDKARRAYFKFRRHDLTNNVKLTIKFFDVLVKPILMYCCEVFTILSCPRLDNNNLYSLCDKVLYENLNLSMCKYLLGIRKNSSNVAARGELGRSPLLLDFLHHTFKYRDRVSEPSNSLVYEAYRESTKCNTTSWANLLNQLPSRLDCFDESSFSITMLRQMYEKSWRDQLCRVTITKGETVNSKLRTLAKVKTDFTIENYVLTLPFTKRRDFSKLRTSAHSLEIETGRYNDISCELRHCKLCSSDAVEDEKHFLLSCPFFHDIRLEIIRQNNHLIDFDINDTDECFNKIFSCVNGTSSGSKFSCLLAQSLSQARYDFFTYNPALKTKRTVVTRVAEGGGRVIRQPDRLMYF